jgi:hypothetical protein
MSEIDVEPVEEADDADADADVVGEHALAAVRAEVALADERDPRQRVLAAGVDRPQVRDELGANLDVTYLRDRNPGPSYHVDFGRLAGTGFEPRTTLREGVRDLAARFGAGAGPAGGALGTLGTAAGGDATDAVDPTPPGGPDGTGERGGTGGIGR